MYTRPNSVMLNIFEGKFNDWKFNTDDYRKIYYASICFNESDLESIKSMKQVKEISRDNMTNLESIHVCIE